MMSKKLGSWGGRKVDIEMIPCVDACVFPDPVTEWCDDNHIPTHCNTSVAQVQDDGNIFIRWMEEHGLDISSLPHHGAYKKEKGWILVGVIGS